MKQKSFLNCFPLNSLQDKSVIGFFHKSYWRKDVDGTLPYCDPTRPKTQAKMNYKLINLVCFLLIISFEIKDQYLGKKKG